MTNKIKTRRTTLPTTDELRELSKVQHPTMIVVSDATCETLEATIIFIKAGDNTYDAVNQAASDARISNAHERARITLPDDFDAPDNGLYWNLCYSG